MRVQMTEIYRDGIDAVKDRVGRARTQRQDIETAIALAANLQE